MRSSHLVAAVFACVLVAGCGGPSATRDFDRVPPDSPGDVAEPLGPPERVEAGPDRGRALYATSCAWCHGQQGQGTQFGPSLVGVGESSADFWLRAGRMPLASPQEKPERSEVELADDDIAALVEYVGALGDGPQIPTVEPGDVHLGMALYLNNCAACHSSSTSGGAMPRGDYAPSLVPSTPTQIVQAIRLGPGAMPAFGEHAMSDEEVDAVVAYIAELRETRSHGGHSLGAYGPAVEGVVGWIVGLGLLLVVARLLGRRAR